MNLKTKNWSNAYDYKVDDVVSFSLPYVMNSTIYPSYTINNNIEYIKLFHSDLVLNKNFEYISEIWTKKSNEKIVSLSDAYIILNDNRSVDATLGYDILVNSDLSDLISNTSTGIGMFVIYKDSQGNVLNVNEENLEKHYSLYVASQIEVNEWSKLIFKINNDHAPEQAVSFNVYLYSNISLEINIQDTTLNENIIIKNPKISFFNKNFYCTLDHTANTNNSPAKDINGEYWTQNFKWRPDFRSRASFTAMVEALKTGEGNIFKTLEHINAITCEFDLSFSMLTENTANAIVHFLQNKLEYDENFYNQNNLGYRENHQDIYFEYDFFFPYKKLKTYCVDFNHSIEFDNIHKISAKFKTRESITSSISSFGYHENLDGKITINFEELETQDTYKFEIPSGEFSFLVGETYGNCVISSIDVDIGDCQIITWENEDGSPLEIFLENYRKIKLKENLSSDDSDDISFESDNGFIMELPENKIEIIIPNPCFKHSMFFNHLDLSSPYPYNRVEDFKHLQSYVIDINQKPEVKTANIDKNYDPETKSGVNANNNFKLKFVFEKRNEKEALEILLFFEKHFGHKSFQFALPDPYSKEGRQRFFYCPMWEHTYVYKDNHTISATFIECVNVRE